MTADQLIQYLSWTLYFLLFVIVAVQAARRPTRANIDIALLFSFPAIIIGIAVAMAAGLLLTGPIVNAIDTALLLGLGYLLLRLVDDFTNVPEWLTRGSTIGLAALALAGFILPPPRPQWLNLLMLLYLVALLAYSAIAFIRTSRQSVGVTRRRMWAVAAGALLLVLEFVLATLSPLMSPAGDLWRMLIDTAGLASGVGFFLGFAPPRWLRRAWQEPELRAFLSRAASLPRLPDTISIVHELTRGAATSVGADANIGLWDDTAGVLRFERADGQGMFDLAPDSDVPAAQAFRTQRRVFSPETHYSDRIYEDLRINTRARAVLAAPITAGEKRLGVLVVYAARAPIFADDDLALVQLLADQAAVILESRALIDEAARVRAIEEATRLKEDFLSAAAHDLKTPLTTLIARAQLLERRALRAPDAPADVDSIRVLVQEGQRLRRLVLELLDAARTEQGQLVGERNVFDLAALAGEICARHDSQRHPCIVEARGPVVGAYDQVRIEQLLENLVENAVKYSPDGGAVRVKVWRAGDQACVSVADSGIGIPPDDLPHIFDRFYRAGNVDDRRFAGMGLGLFICRGIVEQHGGQIVASSRPGQGTTFDITLPLAAVEEAVYV